METSLSVLSVIAGLIWLRRGMRSEAHPDAPQSLFMTATEQLPKERAWKIRAGVLYVMIGLMYGVFAFFHHFRHHV